MGVDFLLYGSQGYLKDGEFLQSVSGEYTFCGSQGFNSFETCGLKICSKGMHRVACFHRGLL